MMSLGDLATGILGGLVGGLVVHLVHRWRAKRRLKKVAARARITSNTTQKLTILMHPEVRQEVQKLADEMGVNLTVLFKRGVALLKIVWEKRDGELLIKQGDIITEIDLKDLPRNG